MRVGGRVAELGQRVPPDAVIDIDPKAREEQSHQVTVLLHKPIGWVSGQAEDGYEPAVALVTPANRWTGDTSGINYHPGHLRHLAPAGRLPERRPGVSGEQVPRREAVAAGEGVARNG